MEVGIAAHESCVHRESGCSHPEVVLIKGRHPRVRLHRSADRIRVKKINHDRISPKRDRASRWEAGQRLWPHRVHQHPQHLQDRRRRSCARFGASLDERSQPFKGQLLDALALCCCDPLKATHKVVRNFDDQVRHDVCSLFRLCRMMKWSRSTAPMEYRKANRPHPTRSSLKPCGRPTLRALWPAARPA